MKLLDLLRVRYFPNSFIKKLSTHKQRRAFFLREYQEMLHRMWRGEFVGAKKKDIREGIRREYDKVNEDLETLKITLKKNTDEPTRLKLDKAIESKNKDIGQFKQQIDSLDKESSDLNELLKGYREGLDLLKELINE